MGADGSKLRVGIVGCGLIGGKRAAAMGNGATVTITALCDRDRGRAHKAVSGGGELIDQGVHLIDMARWFLGAELTLAHAELRTSFWDMPVDDNAFLTLTAPKDQGGQVAHLHASCTEWKNLFSFEIYARHTKLHLEGLGGSYGVERLYHYQMRPEMGPPDTLVYEYPGADTSWAAEWS